MSVDVHFGPNVASDMLALFEHPEQWAQAHANITAYQAYIQNILANEPGAMAVGPNTYHALVGVGAFRKLKAWGLPLMIEGGAVKKWSCDGKQALHGFLTAIDRVRAAGGEVAGVVLDEPAGNREACHLTWDQCAEATSHVIDSIRAEGVEQVGLVEPYPAIPMMDLVTFFERVQQRGSSPSFVHLDVDRFGIRDQHLSAERVGEDLRRMQHQCAAWGIPFGVVIFGQRAETAQEYYQSAWQWFEQLHVYLRGWPDRLIVQSWEQVGGANTLPFNVPESNPVSHCALVRDLHTAVS